MRDKYPLTWTLTILIWLLTPSSLFAGTEIDMHNKMMEQGTDMHSSYMTSGMETWTMVFWGILLVLATFFITRLLTAPERKLFAVSIAVGGRMKRKQYLISFLLLGITMGLHLIIPKSELTLHIIFRFLYLVPIAYVGLKAGKKGGLLSAVITTILYLPHFLFGTGSSEFQSGNLVAVLLFYATGFFSGHYRDASKREIMTQIDEQIEKPEVSATQNILFYVDDKPLSQYATEWFTGVFGSAPGVHVTLLWISVEDVEDILESREQVDEYIANLQSVSKEKIGILEHSFYANGFKEESVTTKIIRLKSKIRVANVIQEELTKNTYDFIVVPKYKLNRSQEFLFGDTAIQLVREAGYPVLTVANEPS